MSILKIDLVIKSCQTSAHIENTRAWVHRLIQTGTLAPNLAFTVLESIKSMGAYIDQKETETLREQNSKSHFKLSEL